MNFESVLIPEVEIVHFYSENNRVTSFFNKITYQLNDKLGKITLKIPFYLQLLGWSRLMRRVLRLDKMNIAVSGDTKNLVIIYRRSVFHYDILSRKLIYVMTLKNCRNLLHNSILSYRDQEFYFGEYGNNSTRRSVPVYYSKNGGRAWEVVYSFPSNSIKHVHACFYDIYSKKIWVATGDFNGECYFLVGDPDFKNVEKIGDGGQCFRAVKVFFAPDSVYWVMDSQLEISYLVHFDRKNQTISKGIDFPGPVWYGKELSDGLYLVTTANEVGDGVQTSFAHLYISRNLEEWQEIARLKHDGWPKRYFKFGVIGFADGLQTSENFALFGEALKDWDGKAYQCRYTE